MSAPSAIPPREYGALYLYAVDLPEAALRALAPPARGDGGPPPLAGAVPDLLGSPALDPAQAELFDLRDLAGLGLSGYLMQGYDIPEARLAPHRAAFDALGGFVLLLRSEAAPEGAPLAPAAGLRFLARLETARPEISVTPLLSDTARGWGGPAGRPAPGKAPRPPLRLLAIAAAGLVAIALWLWLTLG